MGFPGMPYQNEKITHWPAGQMAWSHGRTGRSCNPVCSKPTDWQLVSPVQIAEIAVPTMCHPLPSCFRTAMMLVPS
jgi:hypothetical protein